MARECDVNILDSVALTVDDLLDDAVGLRPATAVKKVWEKIAPANAVERVTGLPKPDDVLAPVQDKIEGMIPVI
jgi:hypothetical protein